jgi:predicted O-linked N-acetylglucosamine transferase (SPINDLY family)
VFARGVAPLQVAYLGYPGTCGGDALDYAIVDHVACPAGSDGWWSEKLVRLPYTYFVTNDRQLVDATGYDRHRLGLPEAAAVFCCFNNSHKFDPRTFDVWMRILGRVPGSVLWFVEMNAEMRANLQAEAARRNIDPSRLRFAPFVEDHARHLGRYAFADLYLDTRHYNAHTTAIDALWCGVPVLTVPGDTNTSRVCESLVRAAGLPELVCRDWQDYEDRAVGLALDRDLLQAQRDRVRQSRIDGHLFETARFAARFDAALERMWQRHCDGLPPAAFDVPAGAGC